MSVWQCSGITVSFANSKSYYKCRYLGKCHVVDITNRQLVIIFKRLLVGLRRSSQHIGFCENYMELKTVKPAVSMHSEFQTKRVHDGTLLHNLEQ